MNATHIKSASPSPPRHHALSLAFVGLCLQGFFLGVIESINILPLISYCLRSPKIVRTLRDCIFINGVLFVSIWIASLVFVLFPINGEGLLAIMWRSIFGAVWVLPIYAFTQMLGLAWYEDLYRTASVLKYESQGAVPPAQPAPSFEALSELLMKALVTLIFGVTAAVVGMIPWVGPPVSFVMSSWLHAFYCFDYRFLSQRQQGTMLPLRLSQILAMFEARWSYFLGFGATHIAIRLFLLEGYLGFHMLGSLAISSAIFAVNVVMTVDARPAPILSHPVKIFTPAYSAAVYCFSRARSSTTTTTTTATTTTSISS